jgi:predicted membrane protein
MNNEISRTVTGGIIILIGIAVLIKSFLEITAIIPALFLLILGFFILFNKKEDKIEEIKGGKNDNNNRE